MSVSLLPHSLPSSRTTSSPPSLLFSLKAAGCSINGRTWRGGKTGSGWWEGWGRREWCR